MSEIVKDIKCPYAKFRDSATHYCVFTCRLMLHTILILELVDRFIYSKMC